MPIMGSVTYVTELIKIQPTALLHRGLYDTVLYPEWEKFNLKKWLFGTVQLI